MKTIVHTCSSVLVRPNGIVRYINAVMDLQRSLGHKTIFVTDAKPTQSINADQVYYVHESSEYVPNMRDGHVWLQVEEKLIHDMDKLYTQHKINADLVVAHDLHSYYAAVANYKDGIFVQHESDVLNPGTRYSFLDDDYLSLQKLVVANTDWRVGMVMRDPDIECKRPIYTPPPFDIVNQTISKKSRGLLYIGDSTERKGAREFMNMARKLGVKPTVITHEPDAELFAGADVYTFGLAQRDEMFALMRRHRVAYIPSKNECLSLAVLECLQFMPVVVDKQYAWTKHSEELGIIRLRGKKIEDELKSILSVNNEGSAYNRKLLEVYAMNTKQYWKNLTA